MKTYFANLLERIIFMVVLFGLLWVLFILGDSGGGTSLMSRVYYYFWMVLPLVGFGIVYHAAALLWHSRRAGSQTAAQAEAE